MERICLDFETTLDFLRGDHATVEKLTYYANREEICISSITLFNLLEAVSKRDVVISFANNVKVLQFDRKAAVIASNISAELKERSADPPIESIIIAAVCMANDAYLFTKKPANFAGIRGLKKV
ncbi:hypothetical protein H0O02_01080 [Candidatus Micrarchaeota archaeon]|nr:hypothetical protein [Candidatus Micrarchaeota archaeon]